MPYDLFLSSGLCFARIVIYCKRLCFAVVAKKSKRAQGYAMITPPLSSFSAMVLYSPACSSMAGWMYRRGLT